MRWFNRRACNVAMLLGSIACPPGLHRRCMYCVGRNETQCIDNARFIWCNSPNVSTRPTGGSGILQGRVFNPYEKGTGGRAPKAPRRLGSGRGLCPLSRKFLYFYIKMVSFYAFPVI